MDSLRRFAEISRPRNAWLLARITALDLFLSVLLAFAKPRSILRLIAPRRRWRGAGVRRKCKTDPDRERRIVRYTDFLIRSRVPLLRGACLKRSLILYRFLNRGGIAVDISFGVVKREGDLVGHSWLTLRQEPYCEPPGRAACYEVIHRHTGPQETSEG